MISFFFSYFPNISEIRNAEQMEAFVRKCMRKSLKKFKKDVTRLNVSPTVFTHVKI